MSKPRGRWFLPDTPDVISMLQRQVAATCDGMSAFAAWAEGDQSKADQVRDSEHVCDDLRRTLVDAVREAFTTPLDPEDLFELSQDLDKVMNGAKNTVRESEAMSFPPDEATADMASLLAEGVEHLRTAFDHLGAKNPKTAEPRDRMGIGRGQEPAAAGAGLPPRDERPARRDGPARGARAP